MSRALEAEPASACLVEWVSPGGLARVAGVSSARVRQLRAAGELPEPDSWLYDGGRKVPLWELATAQAWARQRFPA